MYETLCAKEEMAKADDMGDFRIPEISGILIIQNMYKRTIILLVKMNTTPTIQIRTAECGNN